MAIDWILVVFGAMYLGRVPLDRLAEPLGDTRRRIVLVWGGVYIFAVIAGGFALASGSEATNFTMAAVVFAPAALLGVLLDLVRRGGRAT